jgi:hypothetical protein
MKLLVILMNGGRPFQLRESRYHAGNSTSTNFVGVVRQDRRLVSRTKHFPNINSLDVWYELANMLESLGVDLNCSRSKICSSGLLVPHLEVAPVQSPGMGFDKWYSKDNIVRWLGLYHVRPL